VGQLRISARTAAKIRQLHHLDPEDVRAAVECREGLIYTWHTHPVRGTRAIVSAFVGGKQVVVVLYPVPGDPFGDTFNLASTYAAEG
jgi:hypothetical protein